MWVLLAEQPLGCGGAGDCGHGKGVGDALQCSCPAHLSLPLGLREAGRLAWLQWCHPSALHHCLLRLIAE